MACPAMVTVSIRTPDLCVNAVVSQEAARKLQNDQKYLRQFLERNKGVPQAEPQPTVPISIGGPSPSTGADSIGTHPTVNSSTVSHNGTISESQRQQTKNSTGLGVTRCCCCSYTGPVTNYM